MDLIQAFFPSIFDLILTISILISLLVGIFFMIKYKKTQKKEFLTLGIIFTLFVGGLIYMLLIGYPRSMVLYGPPPTDLQDPHITTE